jgi:hypothetical protein
MDRMKVKIKDGKLDLESLQEEIKKKLPGYSDFKFEYDGNKIFVKARKDTTPQGYVELFLFYFYK